VSSSPNDDSRQILTYLLIQEGTVIGPHNILDLDEPYTVLHAENCNGDIYLVAYIGIVDLQDPVFDPFAHPYKVLALRPTASGVCAASALNIQHANRTYAHATWYLYLTRAIWVTTTSQPIENEETGQWTISIEGIGTFNCIVADPMEDGDGEYALFIGDSENKGQEHQYLVFLECIDPDTNQFRELDLKDIDLWRRIVIFHLEQLGYRQVPCSPEQIN
jgi:hypothetical protein